MKSSTQQTRYESGSRAICESDRNEGLVKSHLITFFSIALLSFMLIAGQLAAAQAGDYTTEWKTMKPLYAVSVDVGRKHVLSYFLNKIDHCDLTLMVTDRPSKVPDGDEIPKLSTARFTAAIDGGESARFDTGEGKALEYACATSARTMRVREVNQIAIASPLAE